MRTDDKTLIEALEILACDIQSGDGIANACIREAAQRLRELTQWHPIETAPKGQTVLFLCEDGNVFKGQECSYLNYSDSFSFPTHWMPLPAPLTESEDA